MMDRLADHLRSVAEEPVGPWGERGLQCGSLFFRQEPDGRVVVFCSELYYGAYETDEGPETTTPLDEVGESTYLDFESEEALVSRLSSRERVRDMVGWFSIQNLLQFEDRPIPMFR